MSEEQEIWRPLPVEEYKNLYDISNLGNWRNSKTKQVLKPSKAGKYLVLHVSKPGYKLQKYMVHRCVACAFVEDPDNDPDKDIVNHINGNKMDNRASNLDWCTASQNSVHAREVLKQRKTTKKIIRIDSEGNEIEYEGIAIAAKKNNIRRQYITECARGKREQILGFKWRYSNDLHNSHSVDLSTMKHLNDYKDFSGFVGYYINKEGQIYGTNKSQFLTHNMSDGYPKVMLYKKGKPYSYYVHVLVAKIFIPNPDNKKVVDHIDNIKTNCHIDNLRWVTHSENSNYYYEMKRNLSVLSQSEQSVDGSGENSEVEVKSDN